MSTLTHMFPAHLRQASWLSTVLRVLALCFVLGTLAHASHTHEQGSASATDTHYNCDYCTSFGGLIDAPIAPAAPLPCFASSENLRLPTQPILPARPVNVAQARAPPAC